MAVSPADFELYSRVTGYPVPRSPQERMRMAPEVNKFVRSRNYARPEKTTLQKGADLLGKAALIGGTLAAAHAVGGGFGGKGLGKVAEAAALANLGKDFDTSGDSPPPYPNYPSGGDISGGVDLEGPIETRSTPSDRDFLATARAKRAADVESADQRRNYRQRSVSRVEQPSQGTSDEFIQDLWGDETPQQPPSQPSITDRADNLVKSIVSTPPSSGSSALIPQDATPADAIRGIGSLWSTDGSRGGRRFAPGGRNVVEEDEYTKAPNFSTVKTAPTLVNPTGRKTIANTQVIGTDQEGNKITATPKAAFTEKDLQFPFPNRTNPGMAFIAASTEAPHTGIPGIDEISVPVVSSLTGFHIPGAAQVLTTAGPYIAGLGRQAAGDIVDTGRFAGSGVNYVARNLRPILQQGKEDWSKGYRDIRTGVQDLGLVKDTANQLMLAAAMKRDQDLGLIEGGAQRVMTWAQKQRSLEGRPLAGTGQLEAGVEHDLGDNAQINDPQQVHEQHQIPPSKGGWKQKHYGQEAAERRMRWDDIRDQKIADFVNQYGTRQEWAQADMEQAMAEQDLLDKQASASREFGPDESTKYAEWGVQQGGRPFVRYQKGEPLRYEYETRPDVSRRIENFLTKGGFDYFSDVKPREIIDSTMDDPDIRKLNRDQW